MSKSELMTTVTRTIKSDDGKLNKENRKNRKKTKKI